MTPGWPQGLGKSPYGCSDLCIRLKSSPSKDLNLNNIYYGNKLLNKVYIIVKFYFYHDPCITEKGPEQRENLI